MRAQSRVRYFALAAFVAAAVALTHGTGKTIPASRSFAFGDKSLGQLGTGSVSTTPAASPTPIAVLGEAQFTAIDGGSQSAIAISSKGEVYTWGFNGGSRLGYTTPGAAPQIETAPRQVPVTFGAGAVGASAGGSHMLVVLQDGRLWSWGDNSSGQLGRSGSTFPAVVPTLGNIVGASGGSNFSLAVDASGNVFSWGTGTAGQLGYSGSSATPVQVSLPVSMVAVRAGALHALALAADGHVWAWGNNNKGQTGQTAATSTSPNSVPGLADVVAIAAGANSSYALDASGRVWAWGQENELGAGGQQTAASPTPRPVLTNDAGTDVPLTGVVSIAAGYGFGLAATSDGRFAGWGNNSMGQLGLTATSGSKTTATFASALSAPIKAVAAGQSNAFALTGNPEVTGTWQAEGSVTCSATPAVEFELEGFTVGGLGNADVMLVLDESGSISATEFTQLKQFATNLVNGLTVGPDDTRVGLVMFASDSRLVLPPHDGKSQVLATINGITQANGATCIGCGLNEASTTLDAYPRSGASRFIVVVTDGQNTDSGDNSSPAAHLAAAIAAAQNDSTVIAVGIGNGVDTAELDAIASDISGQQTAFTTPDFDSLDDLIVDLAGAVAAPGATDVEVGLDLGASWMILGASSSLSGSATQILNSHQITWTLPALDAAGASLMLTLQPLAGGTQPLLVASTYDDDQKNVAVIESAAIDVTGCPATLSLAPSTSTGITGDNHTLTATLLDDFGNSVNGAGVRFDVTSGPNFGTLGAATTNSSGIATRTYSSTQTGTDVIVASLASDATFQSNAVSREWLVPNAPPVAKAGSDQTVSLHGSSQINVVLDGSGSSDDGQRQSLSYSWTSNTHVSASGKVATVSLGRGTHTFTLSVFDGEHTRTDTVTITVIDPTAPVVTAEVAGTEGHDGWYTSDVSVSWSLSDPESGIGPATGCGPIAIVNDTAGQMMTCSVFNGAGTQTATSITIKRDGTAPVLNGQRDLEVIASSANGASVPYPVPPAVDTMSGLVLPDAQCAPPSGSLFPLGVTTVSCTAVDHAGNVAIRSFAITVSDPTPPNVFAIVTGPLGAGGWYRGDVSISWNVNDPETGIAKSDHCEPVAIVTDTASAKYECTVTNGAGASRSASVQVKRDATPPSIATSPNLSRQATSVDGANVGYAAATATDASSGVDHAPSCAPPSGALFPIGTTTVTCTVADLAGNSGSASFDVIVGDSTPPVITAAVTGTLGGNGWYTSAVQIAWTVTDPQSAVTMSGCGPVTLTGDVMGLPVTCSASSAGGTSSATETVSIDRTAPVVTPPANVSVSTPNTGGMVVTYPPATAFDPASGVAGAVSCVPSSGSTFPIGPTTVNCAVADAAGNGGSASFVVAVTLSDSTAPTITPSISGTLGSNGWYRGNVTVTWSVADAQSAIGASTGCGATTIASDTPGQKLTCSATSEGGTSTQSVTIKRDATGPVLTTAGNTNVEAASPSGAVVNYAAPSAVDATSGVAGAPTCAPASGSNFPIGATTVTCTAADGAGNAGSKSFIVTVTDDGEPGRMRGEGHVIAGNDKVEFDFSVLETARGREFGRVEIRIKQGRRGRWDDDRFESRSVDDVRFSNAPEYGPGRNPKTGIDTVLFSGNGKWEGRSGYTYVVTASDRGEPGRDDTFTIVVKASNGAVVFSGGGTLMQGNVQSTRLHRPWSWWHGRDRR